MMPLIVTLKSPAQVLKDFEVALRKARKGKLKHPHYEISFDNSKSFEKFVRNIPLLVAIAQLKPKSVYDLAKKTHRDLANLNKVILFFEDIGALKLKKSISNGRTVNKPIVEYDKIEFQWIA